MNQLITLIGELALPWRLLVFVCLAVLTHVVVILVRFTMHRFLMSKPARSYQKSKSVATLASSGLVFSLYFFCVGFILREFGVSLTAYLASASIVGLAIGFGLQGVVQDVVTGLTFIFSDLVDVGDLVEISGQTGIVRAITMRFVELENALGAKVYIPNRTINNVINYPRGYVRCIVDVTLLGDEEAQNKAEAKALILMQSSYEQFPGIQITPPSNEGRVRFSSGRQILRIKFRIWPNRGQPIETTFVNELTAQMKKIDAEYQNWMIAIGYEVEDKKSISVKSSNWFGKLG
ncbi:mechanosensitive ion channel family protein [Aurantivibrio infirmus]